MNQIDLSIEVRETQSKNGNRRSRVAGKLPAVVYGGTTEPQSVLIDSVIFGKMMPKIHRSTVFNLSDGKSTQQAIIREIQRHPVRENPLHIDFMRIQADKMIKVQVPVHGVGGTPAGVKLGGILEVVTRRVEIHVLPLQVPEYLEIDISGLELGRSVHVSDLKVPEGIEILTDGHETLFIIAIPKALEAAAATPAAGAAAGAPAAAAGKDAKAGAKAGDAKAGGKAADAAKKPEAKKK